MTGYFYAGGDAPFIPPTAYYNEPAADTAAVITLAADEEGVWNIDGLSWSYDDAPTAGYLQIEDVSGTVVFKVDITNSGPGFFPVKKRSAIKGTAMIVTLASGGSGVSGIVNIDRAWKTRE